MRPRRLSAGAIGLVGLLTLLEWSSARAIGTRLSEDPAFNTLAKLITTLPPPEARIFETASALTPDQMGPTVEWLHDVIGKTQTFLVRSREEARLEGPGAKDKLAKIEEAIHVIKDILLPAFNENQAQLSGEILAYKTNRSEQQKARVQTQFFLCIHRTLLCMQVARESGTGLNFDETSVLKTGTGNSSTEQDTTDPSRPTNTGGGAGTGGPDPGGMDPGGRPPEASPFI